MSLLQQTLVDTALLDRLAGISGLGWIVAGLTYVSTTVGIGTELAPAPRTVLLFGLASLAVMVSFNHLELALTTNDGPR